MGSLVGYNTKLSMSTDGSSWTEIAEVTEVSGGGVTVETAEDTPLGQRHARYVALGVTPGTASFTLNYDPATATHGTLWSLANAPAMRHWKISIDGTSGKTYASEGILNSFVPGGFVRSDRVTASVGIQFSGEPTVSGGS